MYFYNLKLLSDSICRVYGEEDKTPLRLISNCEDFTRLRIEMFNQDNLTQ